jgi:hypothetical protein
MSDNTLANEDTGSSEINQATAKTYTEQEVNDMMGRLKGSLTKKLTKQWEDLGDPEELRALKSDAEKRKLDDQKKRGEFDSIMSEFAKKKDDEIRKRDEIIRNYTVDVPLVTAAAQYRAVNAEQVKALLKSQVRLGESGDVEVLDTKGTVRYNDQGQPLKVEDLVKEFIDLNPHFRQAGPSTSQGKSNVGSTPEKVDINKLDMKNPQHRAMYREQMSKNK